MTRATIVVRMLPPQEVNPNWRGSWRKRAAAVAEFRDCARLCTVDALNSRGHPASAFCGYDYAESGGVILDAEIAWCCGRNMVDPTNAPALLKAAIDGIADALWFGDDRHVHLGQVTQRRGEGTVTVTLQSVYASQDANNGVRRGEADRQGV